MRSLNVDYIQQFTGVSEKPESYRELANNFEWAKSELDQDVEGHAYDECNDFLDSMLAGKRGKAIVECGCNLGCNLHRYAANNRCIGVDFSRTGLDKIPTEPSGANDGLPVSRRFFHSLALLSLACKY